MSLFHHAVVFSGVDGLSIDITTMVDIRDQTNKELAMRLVTDIQSGDVFYTDLNGFQVSSFFFYLKAADEFLSFFFSRRNCNFFFVKGRGHYLLFFEVFIVFCSFPVVNPVYPNIRQSVSVLGSEFYFPKPPENLFSHLTRHRFFCTMTVLQNTSPSPPAMRLLFV